MILISACLCGVNCKYNGKNNLNEKALKLLKEGKAMLICPEQMGGMSTPRVPCEIVLGDGNDVLNGKAKVMNSKGEDCSKEFIKGANEALKIGKNIKAEYAILKAKSPSCGFGEIYDGSFKGKKKNGNGVTAELFIKNGIKVISL